MTSFDLTLIDSLLAIHWGRTHPKLVELLEKCWQQDPALRPDFAEIMTILQQIAKEVECDGDERRRDNPGGFFSVLRRGH